MIGAILTALSIAFGAFGAHGLEDRVTEHYLAIFETGVRYQMYSALGLMLISLLVKQIGDSRLASNGARLVLAGTIIFSGSLYAITLSGISVLGAITPIGGVAMIAGWLCVIIAAGRGASKTS
ncbi:hypothetical protein D3C79_904120 [compost metagenome]